MFGRLITTISPVYHKRISGAVTFFYLAMAWLGVWSLKLEKAAAGSFSPPFPMIPHAHWIQHVQARNLLFLSSCVHNLSLGFRLDGSCRLNTDAEQVDLGPQ